MKHLRSLIILICLINGIFSQNNYFCDLRCNFNNAPCYREVFARIIFVVAKL